MANTYTPRRRFRRFAVTAVPGSLAFASEAEIVNLSLAGCAVTTAVPLPTGKKFAVRIGPAEEALEFQGTVRWSRLAEDSLSNPSQPSTYRSGLSFSDVLTERAQKLLHFMEENVAVAMDQQLFGRLEVQGTARASLETAYGFTVETLSSGGLCARLDHPLGTDEEFELDLNLDGVSFVSMARVVTVEASGSERSYAIGMEFLDTEPEQLEILSGFLRQWFEASDEGPEPTPHDH